MGKSERIELLQALAVTAELTGTQLSDAAATMMAADLAVYPLPQVLGALTRCRRELKTRLTVAAIIERLDDGRPGSEEAWAMIPQDERGSVVWTQEMAEAFGVAQALIAVGDLIAARMAFRETYTALVTRARSEQRQVLWMPSFGHDQGGRQPAIEEAVTKGRIGINRARVLLGRVIETDVKLLSDDPVKMPEKVRLQLESFTKRTAH